MKRSAPELYRLGRAHLNAGRNAAARRAFALAAARTDEPDLRARIAGSLAAVTIRQGDPWTAERLCREALQLTTSSTTEAFLQGQLGQLALMRGELDRAVALLDRAIAGIGDEAHHRAPMLLNRSVAHSREGRFRAARADLEAAAPDYAATGNEVERAMAVHNLGWIELLEGDLIRALELMGEAHSALAAASPVNAAICDVDRALVLREAGLETEAERILEQVAATFRAHRMSPARADAELDFALALIWHDPARAVTVAAAAGRRFERIGNRSGAARAHGVRLRALLLADADRSGARARGARPLLRATEVEEVAAQLDRRRLAIDAAMLRLSWQLHEAVPRSGEVRRSRVRIPREAPIPVRLLASEVRAARAASSGAEAAVRRHAADGIEELAAWQRSFGSLDLATSLVMHGRGLMLAGLASAARSGRPDVMFEWTERARQLSTQTMPLRPPPDPQLAEDLAELRQLRVADGAERLAGPRAAELEARVRDRQWSATGSSLVETRATVAELQGSLGDGAAALSYLYTGSELWVLAITAESAVSHRIADMDTVGAALRGLRADLDMAASVRAGPLWGTVRHSLDTRLTVLSHALVDAVAEAIGDRRLVVTVPGILGGVPWAMLPGFRGRTFTLATSATRWLRQRDAGTMPPSAAGFAVGPRVQRGAEEVTSAAAGWGDAAVLHHAATDDVAGLAASVDVLHVAAHGRHAADNPMFSGLELADGTLFGYDIDRISPVPATVVLSACEAGRSSIRWGEEAIGMTRVWLHAGTRAVIATPVVVADDDACELLSALHTGLAAGRAPSAALAEASAATGIVSSFQVHGNGF